MCESLDVVQLSNGDENRSTSCYSEESNLTETEIDPAKTESDAIQLTKCNDDVPRANRRLTDFVLYDVNGEIQHVEMLEETDLFISGRILPLEESSDEMKEKGYKCINFGRVESWAISGYEDGSPVVWLSTTFGDYNCIEPSRSYKRFYSLFYGKAHACIEIYKKLSRFDGGDPNMSYRELLKHVVHSIRRSKIFSQGLSIRKFILSQGEFIHRELTGLDETATKNDQLFCGLPALTSLREQCKNSAWLGKDESADVTQKKKLTTVSSNKRKRKTVPSKKNPKAQKSSRAVSKINDMPATTTKLVNGIWQPSYYIYLSEESQRIRDSMVKKEDDVDKMQLVEEKEDRQEFEKEIIIVTDGGGEKPNQLKSHFSNGEIIWDGEAFKKHDKVIYKKAILHASVLSIGSSVLVETRKLGEPSICLIEYFFESSDARKMAHGRLILKGFQTVLENTANEREVFMTNNCLVFNLSDIVQVVDVEILSMPWGYQHRKENSIWNEKDRKKAKDRKNQGMPMQYFCKSMYCPDKGGFFSFQTDTIGLGTGVCHSCDTKRVIMENKEFKRNSSPAGFTYMGVEYCVNDFVYLRPSYFKADKKKCQTFRYGRNVGLKAYAIGQLLKIEGKETPKKVYSKSVRVTIQRYFRPEDISGEKAYRSDLQEVYYSDVIVSLPIKAIEGKCKVRRKQDFSDLQSLGVFNHIFYCDYFYNHKSGEIKQLPHGIKRLLKNIYQAENTNKGNCKESEDNFDERRINPLSALDIFAGCGGLSEGLRQSGVCETKWAIEYDKPSGEAFKLNHPETVVYVQNCNVILRAIMDARGDSDDCISSSEAINLAKNLDKDLMHKLPYPGEVDFIYGGPPCQGFSGINRHNTRPKSKIHCEMILAFLSFADYFRPKYFLLENVRNFLTANHGNTFRLTLASLIAMGYQVRFSLLEAGAYGISQSRKRVFIWAAAPGEKLPDWPEPVHAFATPKLKVKLNSKDHYVAVRSTSLGAPIRPITVRDSIGDLPVVYNGASATIMEYGVDPISWFQKTIRENMAVLTDHVSKKLSEINFIRCQRIPFHPGADWRVLPNEKICLTKGNFKDLIPGFLKVSTRGENGWKGLCGRLDWEGNFAIAITKPEPTGTVGMCFHPDQHRIVSIREYARSQGFSDSYNFFGNIHAKYRQIGNAVPPPLAFALGTKLKEAIGGQQISKVHLINEQTVDLIPDNHPTKAKCINSENIILKDWIKNIRKGW